MNKKIIIIGASGHGKVIADIVLKSHDILVGFLDDGIEKGTLIFDEYKVLGDSSCVEQYNDCEFIIGIGSNEIRNKISGRFNVKWYTAIHPSAIIATKAFIDEGCVVMANAIINMNAKIGKHCIINTGAIIEHDCEIGDYVHISPNATICGGVNIGAMTHIGASATIRNYKSITSNCVIGMGSVVVADINEEGTYVGIPARRLYNE